MATSRISIKKKKYHSQEKTNKQNKKQKNKNEKNKNEKKNKQTNKQNRIIEYLQHM